MPSRTSPDKGGYNDLSGVDVTHRPPPPAPMKPQRTSAVTDVIEGKVTYRLKKLIAPTEAIVDMAPGSRSDGFKPARVIPFRDLDRATLDALVSHMIQDIYTAAGASGREIPSLAREPENRY